MLFFLLQSENPSEPDRKSAALGSSETGGRSDHRLLTDITADARYGRRKTHTNTIPEDRCERRSHVLAEYRRKAGALGVVKTTGDQLGHRDKRV